MNKRKNSPNGGKNKSRILPALLVPVAVVFALSSIVVTIKVATAGARLAVIENEKAQIAKENENLKRNLIGASSLQDLDQKAKEYGFEEPENVIYIAKDKFVASLRE